MTETKTYTVVEYAGYEDERDMRSFPTIWAAHSFVMHAYAPDEYDLLHIGIRRDVPGQASEYVY